MKGTKEALVESDKSAYNNIFIEDENRTRESRRRFLDTVLDTVIDKYGSKQLCLFIIMRRDSILC